MAEYSIALWDVDTQHDFMDKKGALYVPGAEKIKPAIRDLIDFGRQKQFPILGSVDEHTENDPEFRIFPNHCVKGTYGQSKIFLPEDGELYFKKTTFDIFTNPKAEEAIMKTAKRYAVFGVATDYCVKEVVLGMRKRGIHVYLIVDAIKGVTKETVQKALREMAIAGAKFINGVELRKALNDW